MLVGRRDRDPSPPEQLKAVLQQQQALTPDLALRLARYLGMSVDFWLSLQLRWELYHAQQQCAQVLAEIRPINPEMAVELMACTVILDAGSRGCDMSKWTVELCDEFALEFRAFAQELRTEIAARAELLEKFGPTLGRPFVDTLNGSKHANMKELRLTFGDGVWRIAFAFDPARKAILLIAGDKSGVPERRFYRQLIKTADRRFDQHLKQIGES